MRGKGSAQGQDVVRGRPIQPAAQDIAVGGPTALGRLSEMRRVTAATACQSCDAFAGRYEPLTRVLKPIATALWHCHGNRAATARRGPSFSGRQMEAGRIAAGSSRASRLDPFSLPVRFEAADEAADERRRVVDLHRERVVVRRCVGGMRMALNLPVSAFRGVVIRLKQKDDEPPSAIDVVLEHGDPALSLPLFSSDDRRRDRGGMAGVGPRVGPAAAGRRARRQLARAIRADRRLAHRSAHVASPPPHHDRTPPAFDPAAPPRGTLARQSRGVSRRAGDHRAELNSDAPVSAPLGERGAHETRRAACRQTE